MAPEALETSIENQNARHFVLYKNKYHDFRTFLIYDMVNRTLLSYVVSRWLKCTLMQISKSPYMF